MPTSTDWRIRVSASYNPNGYTGFAEIEMRTTIGGPDQTTGRTATASFFIGGYEPSKAIDDNSATFWTTGANSPPNGGHWIAVNFASSIQIDQISIQVRPDGFREDPKSIVVEYYDGASWVPYWYWDFTTAWSAGETRLADVTTASVPKDARLSQSAVEVTRTGAVDSRLSQTAVEVTRTGPVDARISQTAVEVTRTGNVDARVSQIAAEVFYTLPSNSNFSQCAVEVFRITPPVSNRRRIQLIVP